MIHILKCPLFLILILVVKFGFAQNSADTLKLKILCVYHINENICAAEPNQKEWFYQKGEGITSYTAKEIKPALSAKLSSFLKGIDTARVEKLRGFSPTFLIEYTENGSDIKYILLDEFGRMKGSFYEKKTVFFRQIVF